MRRLRLSFISCLVIVALVWFCVLLLVFYVAETVYFSPAPKEPVYDIAGVADGTAMTVPAAAASTHRTLAGRLHGADRQRGEKVFGQCALCHTPFENGPNRAGPNLWHIVNRPAGAVPDFRYSQAMRLFAEKGRKWDFAALDAFLTAPARAIRGTTMLFAGIKDGQERADLLLYLNTLAEKPVALPPVEQIKKNRAPQ